MKINWETVKFIETLNELAKKTELGFIEFKNATPEVKHHFVLFDRDAKDEHDCPIALDCHVDELHHDIVSTYDCLFEDVIIRVVEDFDGEVIDDPFIVIKSLWDDYEVCIHDGRWYFV